MCTVLPNRHYYCLDIGCSKRSAVWKLPSAALNYACSSRDISSVEPFRVGIVCDPRDLAWLTRLCLHSAERNKLEYSERCKHFLQLL